MAKTIFDPNAAFKNIVGATAEESPIIQDTEEKQNNNEQKRLEILPTQTEGKPIADLLVQKAYYITTKQYRALKLQAAIGTEKDMSAIVRAALDAYLEDVLKKVQ